MPAGENFFAQKRYLQAFERQAPAAMRELASLADRATGVKSNVLNWLDEPTEIDLQSWATKWGFPSPDGWWMRHLRRSIETWRQSPHLRGSWPGFASATYREPKFPAIRWNPNDEPEPEFRQRVERYIASVKNTPGVQLSPSFYERDFDCLVLQHATRSNVRDILNILELDDVDESTVRLRNKQLAEVLGFELRIHRGGRPRTKHRK